MGYKENIEANGFRACVKCGETKAVDGFYARNGRVDTVCKNCKKAAQKAVYQSKADKKGTERLGAILNWLIREETEQVRNAVERLRAFNDEAERTPPGTYPVAEEVTPEEG